MSEYNQVIHLKHPDTLSIYAFVCGQPISPYGFKTTNDFNLVTCSRCKTRQLLAWKKELKLQAKNKAPQKDRRTNHPLMMKELVLQAKGAKK